MVVKFLAILCAQALTVGRHGQSSKTLVIVQEIVRSEFVMFAFPVALDAEILQDPVELLEIDIKWDVDFDYLGGCEIKVGEAKLSATGKKVADIIVTVLVVYSGH